MKIEDRTSVNEEKRDQKNMVLINDNVQKNYQRYKIFFLIDKADDISLDQSSLILLLSLFFPVPPFFGEGSF